MARVIVGKDSGKEISLHQWCNDWVMAKSGKVYRVTNLTFTKDEIEMILKHDCGTLWEEFELCKNMRFKRRIDHA
jgi:hypothetical protein